MSTKDPFDTEQQTPSYDTSLPGNETSPQSSEKENIRMIGLSHLLCYLIGMPFLGPIVYYIVKKDTFKEEDTKAFLNTLNFFLSYIIYSTISALLILVVVGFVLLGFFAIAGFVGSVLLVLNNLNGKDYKPWLTLDLIKSLK